MNQGKSAPALDRSLQATNHQSRLDALTPKTRGDRGALVTGIGNTRQSLRR